MIWECLPKTALCPTSRLLVRCPSKLPILCPNTSIKNCWSHLLCVVPTTRMVGCQIKTFVGNCPSAVDACPSAPAGCGLRSGRSLRPGVDPRLGRIERRLAALESERWSNGDSGDEDEDGWFYVDDDGEVHEV